MKKFLLLFSILIFCFLNVKAENFWTQPLHSYSTYSLAVSGTNVYAGTITGILYSSNSGQKWSPIGQGLNYLYTTCIEYNNGELYVGTDGEGINFSSNNGQTWSVINSGITHKDIKSIICNGSYVYAAAIGASYISNNKGTSWTLLNNLTSNDVNVFAQKDTCVFAGHSNGSLSLSNNNGISWTLIGSNFGGKPISSIVFSGDSKIYVATLGSGVYVSTNDGATWNLRSYGINNLNVSSLTVIGSEIYAATLGGGIFKSTDDGLNWNTIGNGFTNVLSLAHNSITVFAGVKDGGVYSTTNSNPVWNSLSSGLTQEYNYDIATTATNVYLAGKGAFVSTNQGKSWINLKSGITANYLTCVAVSGYNVFYGSDQGVFVSTNSGSTFSLSNTGLTNTEINDLTIVGANVYAGTNDGIYKSTDNGITWNNFSTTLSGKRISIISGQNNTFAVKADMDVYISTNSGATWSISNNGITNLYVACLLVNGSNIFAGVNYDGIPSKSLYLTTNSGNSWVSSSNGINSDSILAFAVKNNYIFVATTNGVYASSNSGANWTGINSGLIDPFVLSIGIQGNNIFVGTYAGLFDHQGLNLSAPILISPDNNSTQIPINSSLSWNQVQNALSYKLQISKSSNFDVLEYNSEESNTSKTLTGLAYNTKYYWRVQAINTYITSEWSEVRNFKTIDLIPNQPTLISPVDKTTGSSLTPNFAWNSSLGAAGYRLNVCKDSNCTIPVIDKFVNSLDYSPTDNLQSNTKYFWRVKAYSATDSSSWSPIWSFTTQIVTLPKLVLTSPVNAATNTPVPVKLNWNISNGCVNYLVQLSKNPNFDVLVSNSIETLNTKVIDGLINDTKYYWRVKGYSSNDSTDWSETWNFTTAKPKPGKPILVSPGDATLNVEITPTIQWGQSDLAINYLVQVSNSANFNTFVHNNKVNNLAILLDLSYNTKYYWRVKAFSDTDSSDWSQVWSFTTKTEAPNQVVLSVPTNKAENVNLNTTLEWLKTKNAISYRAQLSLNSNFSSLLVDKIETNFFTYVTKLQFGTTYYWRVKAFSATDSTDWSEVRSFTTIKDYGVEENTNISPTVSLKPNPSSSSLYIIFTGEITSDIKINVYNELGIHAGINSYINETKVSNIYEHYLDVSNLANGNYYVLINTNGITIRKSFVILK